MSAHAQLQCKYNGTKKAKSRFSLLKNEIAVATCTKLNDYTKKAQAKQLE